MTDWMDDYIQQQKQTQTMQNAMAYGVQQNPDQYAAAKQTGQQLGVSPEAVQSDPATFQQQAKLQSVDYMDLLQRAPALSTWLTDPGNAAQAHDDLWTLSGLNKNLQDMGRQLLVSLPRNYGQGFEADAGLVQTQKGQSNAVQDYFRQMTRDPFFRPPETPGGQVVDFIGGIIAAASKAVLSGPAAPVVFALEGAGSKNAEALDEGATQGQARMEALGSGAVNYLVGRYGLPFLGGPMAKATGQVIEEAVAQGAVPKLAQQSLVAEFTRRGLRGTALGLAVNVAENALSRIHDPNRPLTQNLLHDVVNMTGMELAGGVQERIVHAQLDKLDAAARATQDSKLAQRNQNDFVGLVAQMADGAHITHVGIPADKFGTFFQDQMHVDPAQVAQALGVEDYAKAAASGHDLQIPLSQYLTQIASDPKLYQGLRDDTRIGDNPTWNELGPIFQQMDTQAEALKAQIQPLAPELQTAFDQIQQDQEQKILAAKDEKGKPIYNRTWAKYESTLLAHGLVTTASRFPGLDPLEEYRRYGLDVVGPQEGTTPPTEDLAAQNDRQFAQYARLEPNETFYQPAETPEQQSTRNLLREARKTVSGLEKPNLTSFLAAKKTELGDGYQAWLKGLAFEGHTGKDAAKAILARAQTKEIPGAPPAIRDQAGIDALHQKLLEMAKGGASARNWYADSEQAIWNVAGHDDLRALKIANLAGLFSPTDGVPSNGAHAIRAAMQYEAGEPIEAGHFPNKARPIAEKIMAAQTPDEVMTAMKGQKILAFAQSLIQRFLHPDLRGDLPPVIDIHMMRAGGYENESPSAPQFQFMGDRIRAVAKELGWKNEEAQAAIWSTQKSITDKTTPEKAGFHFGDAFDRIAGNMTVESMPGNSVRSQIFPGIGKATPEQLREFHQQKMDMLRLALNEAGIPVSREQLGHGYWDGESNPVTAFRIPLPAAKGGEGTMRVEVAGIKAIRRACAIVGTVLEDHGIGEQEAVGWNRPFDTGSKEMHNAMLFTLSRALTPEEMANLGKGLDALGTVYPDASNPAEIRVISPMQDWAWAEVIGAQVDEDGNIKTELGKNGETKIVGIDLDEARKKAAKFHKLVRRTIGENVPSDVERVSDGTYHSEGELLKRDQYAQELGNGRRNETPAAGSSDLQGRGLDHWREENERINQAARDRWGWGSEDPNDHGTEGPTLHQGGRPDEASDGPGGGLPEFQGRSGGQNPISVHGVHYSTAEGLDAIDGGRYGTGSAGRERQRLGSEPKDSPLWKRVYFYESQNGELPRKEAVVRGNNPYEARLNNFYDLEADPEGIGAAHQGDPNGIEHAIIQAGYDGYVTPSRGIHGRAGVVLGHEEVPVRSYQDTLHQGESGDHRGYIKGMYGDRLSIGLLKGADASTYIHELGHFWVRFLSDLSARPDAPQQIKDDFQALLDHVGAQDYASLTREQHEELARLHEAYLMKGDAPSAALEGPFARFKDWMTRIYQTLTSLKVHLTPQVQGVFDRIYASDQEIEAKAKAYNWFATPEQAGMTPEKFAIYQKLVGRWLDASKAELNAQLQKEFEEQQDAPRREEREQVRTEIAQNLAQDPVRQAHRALVNGQTEDGTAVKLDRAQLADRIGEDETKALEREHGGSGRAVYGENGMDLDTAAELLNEKTGSDFSSGDDLANRLRDLEPTRDAVERMTEEEMTRRHGDALKDGSLPDYAQRAMANVYRAQALEMELKAIREKENEVQPAVDYQKQISEAKSEEERQKAQEAWEAYKADQKEKERDQRAQAKAAITTPPLSAFRLAAHTFLSSMSPDAITPNKFLEASRIASRKAAEAMAKADWKTAGDAKTQELLNHFLFREAVKEKAFVGKLEATAERMSSVRNLKKLGMLRGSSQDVVRNTLARYGLLDPKAAPAAPEADSATMADWIAEMASKNEMPSIPDSIQNESRVVDYHAAPMSELHDLRDALVNMQKLVNRQTKMRLGDQEIEWAQVMAELEGAARGNFDGRPMPFDLTVPKTARETVASKLRSWDAVLLRMEQYVNWLDHDDVNGPWHKYVWNPISEAASREVDMDRAILERVNENFEKMPKEQREHLLDRFEIQGLPEPVTRKWIISALMNMGNDGNREKMIKGMGWANNQEILAEMFSKLNRHDAQFVQDTWDTIHSLWPASKELQYRMSGLEPTHVEPKPFSLDLSDGRFDFQGGYYPLKGDPIRSRTGAMQAEAPVVNLTDKGFERPDTPQGHLKTRTGATYPLLLDYDQILSRHLTQTIQDITHREAVTNAYKIISDPQIRKALAETLGEEHLKQFLPWLKTVVNDRNYSASQGLDAFSKILSYGRRAVVTATMGFKLSTALVQYTGITRSLHYVGAGELLNAIGQFAAHPQQTIDMVRELSGEMRSRSEHLDRDYREMMAEATGQNGFLHEVNQFAFKGIAMADAGIGIPTWLAGYNQALKAGKDEPTAILEADRAVRLTQPTAGAKDLPAIMRQNDAAKLATMFYGHFSVLYQNLRDAGHKVNGVSDMPKFAASMLFSAMIPAIAGELILARGPQDDEDKAKWAALKSLHFATSSIPLLRDCVQAWTNYVEGKGGDYRFSPLFDAMKKNVDAMEAAAGTVGVAKADHPLEDTLWKSAEAISTDLGIPGTAQAFATARYLDKVHKGEVDDTPAEAAAHVAFGYHKEK